MTAKEEVMELLTEIPGPPDTELPKKASKEEIEKLSNNFIGTIPKELNDWLSSCNAPLVGTSGLFFGVYPAPQSRLIEWHYQLHPYWVKMKWIPVAGDGSGNYYILDGSGKVPNMMPIYFIDHEESYDVPCYVVASELWIFLRFVLEQEKTKDRRFPFDKDYVLEKDPNLKTYTGNVPLPWQS